MNPKTSPEQSQTTVAHHTTTHRRTLAATHRHSATSSTEPTKKKHPNSYTLLRESIIEPISKLYLQNAAVSSRSPISLSKPKFEPGSHTKIVSNSEIEDKPMSNSSHLSRKTTADIEKRKIKSRNYILKPQIETSSVKAKPVYVSSIQDKPMSKSSHQSRKTTVEIEREKLRASIMGDFDKDSTILRKSQNETGFQAKPISVSLIQEKPMSKSIRRGGKTTLDIEKEKLRASINGGFDKPQDFKTESLKKFAKKERAEDEKSIVSLSKSQDNGVIVAHRGLGGDAKRPSFSVTGGRRRSFGGSQAGLADFLSCNGVRIVSVDMPPFMQIHAVDCARKTFDSLEKFTSKSLALTLKREFDGVYGPAWHCIVGSSFGSFVTHSVGGFMYFSMDHKIYILLFKTTVKRAD